MVSNEVLIASDEVKDKTMHANTMWQTETIGMAKETLIQEKNK
jgi:hypothetical protein